MNDFSARDIAEGPLPGSGGALADHLHYDGKAGELAGIGVTNALLTLITLGFYRFWAKTRVRRYLWGHIDYQGDRLEYTGRASELLIGFLIALLILAPLVAASIAVDTLFLGNPIVIVVKGMVQLIFIVFLIQVAIYRARRYRLSRTQWRGIRIGQGGSSFKYALRAFGWMIVVGLTWGLAFPVYRTRMQAFRTNNTWFGDRQLEFDGRASDIFGKWFIAWILWLPTAGLINVWYRVAEFRYFTSRTGLGALRFRSELSTFSVILLLLGYGAAVAACVGLVIGGLTLLAPGALEAMSSVMSEQAELAGEVAGSESWPFVLLLAVLIVSVVLSVLQLVLLVHPMTRMVCHSLTVTGTEDFAAIAQSQQYAPARGEGLADALDVGAI